MVGGKGLLPVSMASGQQVRLCLRRAASVLAAACLGLEVLEWLRSPG